MINIQNNKVSIGNSQVDIATANDCLADYLTDSRRAIIDRVIESRCKSIVPVLENIYDRGNISAVMRSSEAHGFYNLNLVEQAGAKFKNSSRVSQGTEKWLNINKFNTTKSCIKDLKNKGFQIVCTSLESAKPIGEVDFTIPTAIVFGNEKDGVSREMLEASDANVIIPMKGFAQSFNISVAAAISFYHIYSSREQKGLAGDLTGEEKERLRLEYNLRGIKHPEEILLRRLGLVNKMSMNKVN